ncbi:hypothetical protein [Yersinia ruckeri]|uniref:hypothetical protein n=1 Tax=Yersinia ruckeri TaxID=29486 RepID=UPI00223739E5|nr:hypothetical protein [Yersinia ruckeri]MCW6598778.1 hypothetical protein [Yersinia ruckeri]
MKNPSTKDLRTLLALNKCQFNTMPTAFQFGFNAISFLFHWHRAGRSSNPSLLAFGSSLSDTTGESYTDNFDMFKSQYIEDSRVFLEDASFIYNERIASPLDITAVIKLILSLECEMSYPVVGFNALKNLTSLQTLAAILLGKDHDLIQRLVNFKKNPSCIVDLSKACLKLKLSKNRNIDYKAALQLHGLTEYAAVHPCIETSVVREVFNHVLHQGIAQGLFTDFSSMISWLHEPELVTIMYFGKHEGTPLPKLPKSYVNYLLDSSWIFDIEHADLVYSLRNMDLVQKAIEAQK